MHYLKSLLFVFALATTLISASPSPSHDGVQGAETEVRLVIFFCSGICADLVHSSSSLIKGIIATTTDIATTIDIAAVIIMAVGADMAVVEVMDMRVVVVMAGGAVADTTVAGMVAVRDMAVTDFGLLTKSRSRTRLRLFTLCSSFLIA